MLLNITQILITSSTVCLLQLFLNLKQIFWLRAFLCLEYKKIQVPFFKRFLSSFLLHRMDDVVKAFMRCINEKKMNANAIAVLPHNTLFDVHFPAVKPSKL